VNETRLECVLAIPMSSIEIMDPDDERPRRLLYSALDDMCSNSGKLRFLLDPGEVYPSISLLDAADLPTDRAWREFASEHSELCELLIVEATIERMPDTSRGNDDPGWRFYANLMFCKRISDLLVISNVSRLGAIELKDSFVVQDGKVVSSHVPPMSALELQDAANIAKARGWPSLHEVSLKTTWDWCTARNRMLDGFDGSQSGRGLCAFSRLLTPHKPEDELQLLVWALVGLEAMFVRSKTDGMRQVRSGAELLIGSPSTFKKALTKLYDFRSRFIHGAVDFPGLFLVHDATDAVSRFDKETLESLAVAVAVLGASLQELARRDWSGIEYEMLLRDSAVQPVVPVDRKKKRKLN